MGFRLGRRADGCRQPQSIRLCWPSRAVCYWYWLPLLPLFLVYFISGVAETNPRSPSMWLRRIGDRGRFHVNYSGMAFAVFFLAEYANMI